MTAQETGRTLFAYTPGEPYEYLADLRENCPVYWDPMLRGHFLTRFDDVYEVMFDIDRFRLQTRPEEQYTEHQPRDRVRTFNQLLAIKVLQPRLDSVVQAEIDLLIDGFVGRGSCEFYDEFAERLPAHVIGTLFGLERSDFPLLLSYRRARHALFNAPPDATEIARIAMEEQRKLDARMDEVIAEHRETPRDNLLSMLLEVREEGELLSHDQIIQIVVRDLLMAGSETVTGSLCNGLFRLLSEPGLYDRLVADPGLVPDFVEEALRYDPPVQLFWRAPNQDVELSGCPIKRDEQLYTSIASANRDPTLFDDPARFDIDRPKGRHITFSVGQHKCPGAFLARSELELSMSSILRRLPNLHLDPDAEAPQLQGTILRNFGPLHVRFDAG